MAPIQHATRCMFHGLQLPIDLKEYLKLNEKDGGLHFTVIHLIIYLPYHLPSTHFVAFLFYLTFLKNL